MQYRWRGSTKLGPPNEREANGENDECPADECEVVRRLVADALPNLVQTQNLVLNRSVIQIEGARPHEDASTRPSPVERPQSPRPPQEQASDNDRAGRHEVKQSVGDKRNGYVRAVVEVVPTQELVKDHLVKGSGKSNAEQSGTPDERP
jgi:hypothetical protein